MPTYEYRCENGHLFEEFQSMAETPIEICPVCGGQAARLISGGSGLIFKGSGFYQTDYARKNTSPRDTKSPVESAAKETASPPESSENKESKAKTGSGS